MKNGKSKLLSNSWLGFAIVAFAVVFSSTFSFSQDSKSEAKSGEKAATEAPAETPKAAEQPATADAKKPEAPATTDPPTPPIGDAAKQAETTPPAGGAGEVSKSENAPPEKAAATSALEPRNDKASALPAGKSDDSLASKAAQSAGTEPAAAEHSGWGPWAILVILVGLFVLPIMIGNYLAKLWKMPDHGWKISLALGVTAASLLVCIFGQPKYGPDLAGGITLIYELQNASVSKKPDQPQHQGDQAPQVKSGEKEFTMSKLTDSLKRRLDPDGTKEITIREYGPAVEIIIPEVGQDEMEFVKEKITKMGQLEFRITADPNLPKDKTKIDLAKLLSPYEKDLKQGDDVVARWVPYDVNEFGPVDQPNGYVKRMAGDTPEVLVLIDPYNVTGEYLTNASKGIDEHGGPAVHFRFSSAGAQRFEKLTGQNVPNPATPDVYRHLGILLDNTLVNAPVIRSTISDQGQISGGNMTDRDVELNVQVLDAGSLPAALNKEPISQELISPTLGGQTVDQGKRAVTLALVGVVVFMLIYYRFAGVIACIALTLNLVMVLAMMILIKAAFTLPGIAGLALTVGMSVDTNVLIYERIREELENGAALRMAIRNGFERAMTAIIDTHLTTIISGIVLFYVGTDQVKGFAVTLILGLVTNLFTAYFCTRVMFDIAERRGVIKQLKMMHLFKTPNFDFLKYRWLFLIPTWALIAIGLVAVYFRGATLLDIDFTGGSSVTFTLNDKDKMSVGDVRSALMETELKEKNLLIVELGDQSTTYTVDSSEQSVDEVKKVLMNEFGDKLKKYSIQFQDVKAISDGGFNGAEAKIIVNAGQAYQGEEGMSHDALHDQIVASLAQMGRPGVLVTLANPKYRPGSGARYTEWNARLAGLDEATATAGLTKMKETLDATPLFPLANTIGSRVSGNMQSRAFLAVGISILAMIVYLWFRFQKVSYGVAAGVALIHDVLMTVGMIALSDYIVRATPGLAEALQIRSFQINLTIVAALLTIIGFSVNDTIVTFDRLREIKGKSPKLTAKMVNDSVNQTLGRTILTVFTVFIVVLVLYFFGGDGLHSFAFAFLVGVVVGTYSSIYIASPVLLWLSGVSAASLPEEPAAARGMQPAR
jgi:SecD/SecF fusion protein